MNIRVVCAIVFILFSWCWLYYFQNDLLAMAQHVLSQGITRYNRFLGALGITFILYLLQHFIHKITKLNKSFYALTFFPSMLALGMVSDIIQDPEGGITHSFKWWAIVFYVLIWCLLSYLANKLQEIDEESNACVFSRSMWLNLVILVFMMMITAGIGNTNAVFHYRMRAEVSMLEGDWENALAAGRKSLESDADLVMLRMHALARKDLLGEKLFEYKVCGSSQSILPTDGKSTFLIYPTDSLYQFLGAIPAHTMTPMHYLELVKRHVQSKGKRPNKAVGDYLLSGYLIDKHIDMFASEISKYYTLNDSLPKHYREALVLYSHLHSKSVVDYHDTVLEEDYEGFRELRSKYPVKMEQQGKVEEQYFGTYWYYYWYE